jgi:uncharacterized membrane protein
MKSVLRIAFWVLVAVSLLGNAVAIGLMSRAQDLRTEINGGGMGFAGLPDEVRTEFRNLFRENRRDFAPLVTELGDARRAMFAAGAAQPFDPAATEAAMARVRAASAALQAKGQELLMQAFRNVQGGS